MNTFKIKAMYPLRNHQKHISLSKVLKERHANSRRFVRFKSPQWPEPGYKTDHLLETGILRKKTEGDNIEQETLLKIELWLNIIYANQWINGRLIAQIKIFLEVTCLASKIVLHQTNDELKSLVSETWSAAFLELAQQSVDWTEMV